GVLYAVNADDAIPWLNAGLGGGSVVEHPATLRGLIQVHRMLVVHHEDAGQKHDREQNVHGGPGNGDYKALPPGVGEKFPRIAGARLHGVLAAHFDVAAQGDSADAVVGITLLEAGQALAEANGESFDPHSKPFGRDVVAKFVDQDHEAEDDADGENGGNKIVHAKKVLSLDGGNGPRRGGAAAVKGLHALVGDAAGLSVR